MGGAGASNAPPGYAYVTKSLLTLLFGPEMALKSEGSI